MKALNLDKFVGKLVEPYIKELIRLSGDNICSIMLFGSAATKDFIPRKSNINLLVVCDKIDLPNLKKYHKLVRWGRKKGIVAPLFLTEQHIKSSMDVFPIEFLEMKDSHILLHGKDVFDNITINTENLRLECEEQLKGKLVRLRQSYLEHGVNVSVITESITSFMPVFRSLARLRARTIKVEKEKVIEELVKLKIDNQVFSTALEIKKGKCKLKNKALELFFEKYIKEIEKLCIYTDSFKSKTKKIKETKKTKK
jgi:predicted nucleotidyltransferase